MENLQIIVKGFDTTLEIKEITFNVEIKTKGTKGNEHHYKQILKDLENKLTDVLNDYCLEIAQQDHSFKNDLFKISI